MPLMSPVSPVMRFESAAKRPVRYVISGVTRNTDGSALGSCAIKVYEAASGALRGTTTSDASGNYTIDVTTAETGLTFSVTAYSSDGTLAGATVNTLVGTPA